MGRYKEPCLRYVWDKLESEIDIHKQATMLGSLLREKTVRSHSKRQSKLVAGQSRLNVAVSVVEQASRNVKPTVQNN